MTDKITFKFVDLEYQIDAVTAVIRLFNGQERMLGDSIYRTARAAELSDQNIGRNPALQLGYSQLLSNLQEVQRNDPHLLPDDELLGKNYTVDMETGTGKTYVYLRTILELHKIYGFTKFLIVVPRIAILAGVKKSIEQMTETFKALYDGLDISTRAFLYNSKKLGELQTEFIESADLSILIMNKDAFNKSGINIIQQEREGKTKLWDLIKATRPIIIIDEPQLIEGNQAKKSSSLRELENLNPLFTLRYSATHKNPYNCIYRLTSYDAYNQHLVKKIRVKTVYGEAPKDFPYIRYVKFTENLKARIEFFYRDPYHGIHKQQADVCNGSLLYNLSGELPQYENMIVDGSPHKIDGLTIAHTRGKLSQFTLFDSTSSNSHPGIVIKSGLESITLFPGDCTYNETLRKADTSVIRVQIRIAIKSHFDTQFAILDEGKQIKAIALFFIDEVKHIRDEERPDGRGLFLRIFDEEYEAIIQDPKYQNYFQKYANLFPEYQETLKVREGYFARDKHNKIVEPEISRKNPSSGVLNEDDYKAKSKEDIERGIDLILQKKEELISFETPLAFIFSHSALREGWDNPNVFTLCTLKESSNDIAKKQEIGRGLRLPIDTQGNRCYSEKVNWLTVIANAYYDDFAANLQKDFDAQQDFNKDAATLYELHKTLERAGIPPEKITKDLVKTLEKELREKAVINSRGLLNSKVDIQKISFANAVLQEHAIVLKKAFCDVMQEKGTRKIYIENGDEPQERNDFHSYIIEPAFKNYLEELTARLEKRTFYQVKIDSEEFIQKAGQALQKTLMQKRSQVITTASAEVSMKEDGKTILENKGETFTHEKRPSAWQKRTDFQVLNYIMKQTRLPRLAIYRIMNELDESLKTYLSMQDFLDDAATELRKLLTEYKSQNVVEYQVIEGCHQRREDIFSLDSIEIEDIHSYRTKMENHRALCKYYKMDSEGEIKFAQQLDDDEQVLLFTKLHKGGFVIDTPQGNYTPDWAVVYKQANGPTRLYFIIETKCKKEQKDLSTVEKVKIKCGEKHFEAVSRAFGTDINYFYAKDYQHFKEQAEASS